MNNPVEIILNPDRVTVKGISQVLYHVESREKMGLLLGLLKNRDHGNTLIFTNTKQAAYIVAKRLESNGYQTEYLIGDLPQKKRQDIIDTVKSGQLPYLVATDVAARGLHIDNLGLVINYDLPEDPENYVHRIGRTGRLGKSGQAITLACEKYVLGLEALESFINMKIPVTWADEGFFEYDASEGIHFRLDLKKNDKDSKKPRRKNSLDNKSKNKRHSVLKGDNDQVKARNKRISFEKKITVKMQSGSTEKDRLEYYSKKYDDKFKSLKAEDSA